MAIKFVCSCGKRLRARDELAARRSICPRCGELVGVPARQPAARSPLPGPMTPSERLRTRRCVLPGDDIQFDEPTPAPSPNPSADELARLLLDTIEREAIPPEESPQPAGELRWYHFVLFPIQASWLSVLHGCILSLPLVLLVGLVPALLEHAQSPSWKVLLAGAFLALLPLAVAGNAGCFLDSVLAAPPERKVLFLLYRPSREVGPALKSALQWCVCFLAGPIVPAGLAAAFGLYGGFFTILDWLILAELVAFTASYWLFVRASVSLNDRLRDVNPFRVADFVYDLGYRAAIAALLASVLAVVHLPVLFLGFQQVHQNVAMGLFLLAGCCMSGLFGCTFLFRLLGVWCHRVAERRARAGEAASAARR
jgi:hypothetical protein